jgi:hypothetical protein
MDGLDFSWLVPGQRPGYGWVASLEKTRDGKYKVDQCKYGRETGRIN